MSSARQPIEGPFARSVREALENVASGEVVDEILDTALAAAGRATVPEDAPRFVPFYEGPLRAQVMLKLGSPALEIVDERLSHMMRMAMSQVMPRCGRVEPSAPPLLSSPSDELWEPSDEFWEEDSAIRPSLPREESGSAAPSTGLVLMLTLDPTLIADAQQCLGATRVATVTSIHDLLARMVDGSGPAALVIDGALPSIDVPTVASLGGAIPATAKVIVWGMSERQKERLITLFPVAKNWIASGSAASLADLV